MPEQTALHQDTHLKVLRLLQANPRMNQRELAVALGVSLGKTNFCLKALLDKGLLKVQNFHSSKRKLAYAYLLTPAGVAEKTALAGRFLARKMQEYELLKAEIEALRQEAVGDGVEVQTHPCPNPHMQGIPSNSASLAARRPRDVS